MSKNIDKIERLYLILQTIRNINRLIINVRDKNQLLKGICNNLIENRGYYNAWIAIFDESGLLDTSAQAGLDKVFQSIVEQFKNGELTDCIRRALAQSDAVVTEDPPTICTDCSLSANYAGRGAMTMRLEYNKKVYGILCVSIPKHFITDSEEKSLLEEVAKDIAFALHSIEEEEVRKQTEEEVRKKTHYLGERVKELNCLYRASQLMAKPDISLEETFQGIVDLIPLSWQYPEITCARISFKERELKTDNFREALFKQAADIMISGKKFGAVEVYYLEEKPAVYEGPFLKEERELIDGLAREIGKFIERKQAEDALQKSEKLFRDLVENSLIGISIMQEGRIIYQNPEQKRLLRSLPLAFSPLDFEGIHPEDVEKVRQLYQRITVGEVRTLETDFRFYPPDKINNSTEMKWVYCRASLIDYQGKEAILINMMDITRAKELEHLLMIQDKMASLGHVAAGIAHEIRNPLSGINIYLNTLEKIYNNPENVEMRKDIIERLQSASNQIESVIRRVMDFSKPSEPKIILKNINEPIEEAIKLCSITLRKSGIKIEKALAENLPLCHIDPYLIEEAILNLINNAAEAMKGRDGIKKIEVVSATESDFILISVSDSGPGISFKERKKIFDPFYTTKKTSTGIGLSIAHRIIADHGGSIDVHTSKWSGAEFRIKIPINRGLKQR